jgi:hypothetical protein
VRYVKETGDFTQFSIPPEKCETSHEKLEMNHLSFLWADTPHFGVGYSKSNFRLHMVFSQPDFVIPPNVTYLMSTPSFWRKNLNDIELKIYQKRWSLTPEEKQILDSHKEKEIEE